MTAKPDSTVLDDLHWRGLVAESTDEAALRSALTSGPVTYYCGFDPTAASLHHGHLVQLITMRRLQLAGHNPLALVGGSTGLIGDPKPDSERTLHPPEVVAGWVEEIKRQIEPILSFDGPHAARMVNNLDWTAPMTAIEFLRDIGRHFRVNKMLAKEAVRARMDRDIGIGYAEFSYQILQALDYRELYLRYGCTLQYGGSDQWGNITAGVDLIRRAEGKSVHALATPLLTKADGTKYGKSEGNAVWLSPAMMSPYAFYQFWINLDDADVGSHLRFLSFRAREEIEELEKATADRPAAREGQRALAEELTSLVHGSKECERVIAASQALFGRGAALTEIDERTLDAALRETPHVRIETSEAFPAVADLMAETGLSPSKSAARRTIGEGGVYLNNVRIEDDEAAPTASDLLYGRWLVLRRGRRNIAGVELVRA